jgi:Polyketide cyclase / dehydrase and lipid transport
MSEGWCTEGNVNLFIDATPEVIYRVLADVTGTGERSTECRSCSWLPGAEPGTVGARFRGRNRSGLIRWSRVCEVILANPSEAFAYRTVPERIDPSRKDSTTWQFALTRSGSGTKVEHSYVINKLPSAPFKALYGRMLPQHRDMRPQMAETLQSLSIQVGSET